MKIASYKTLNNNRKTRLKYAYYAIELDLMCGENDREEQARIALDNLNSMKKSEMLGWALRRVEWLELNHKDTTI